jgi:hypothetical protein
MVDEKVSMISPVKWSRTFLATETLPVVGVLDERKLRCLPSDL